VLLARWLSPAGYGGFAVAFAVLVLIAGPHSALLTDPINVVASRLFRGDTRRYLRAVFAIHIALTIPLVLLITTSAIWRGTIVNGSPVWLVALGVTTPTVLSLWLLRTACYLETRPALALNGSVVYATILLGLVIWARAGSWLTGPIAFVSMGVASAVGGFCIAWSLGLLSGPWTRPDIISTAREHWAFGRWILAASVAHAVANGLYLPILGVLGGLHQSAVLRALQNLQTPLQQVLASISMVAYPFMSRQVAEQGTGYVRRRGSTFVLLNMALASAYGLTIAAFGRPLLAAIYGSGYYTAHASLVALFAATAALAALAQCLGILVRSIYRPQAVLWAKMAGAAWFCGAGIPLVQTFGVEGAIIGLGGGALAESIVLSFALGRRVYGGVADLPSVRTEDVL
jgi:O-antigen/teichoic acid export membrane protein